MLTFLALAAKKRYIVDAYEDTATATIGKNEQGRSAITHISLSPKVVFSGEKIPEPQQYRSLHDRAHEYCFIANSVARCVEVTVEAEMKTGD
jgi:organic hydroperoxide reductase OsmC/OhrA